MTFLPVLLPLLLAAPQDAAPAPEVLPHASLVERLDSLAAEHAEIASTFRVARSRGGRDVIGVRLAAGEVLPGRPAVLVVGNLEGPETFSGALVLWQAERLAADFAADEATRALLESTTLYLVPRVNADGAEARFATPRAEQEGSGHGVDDDRDGREGEDPAADVDGDGAITWMRVPDPEGGWLPDPADPRASIEADAKSGERGRFRLTVEGRDLDGDGEVAEDAPLDARVNRNFPAGWKEHSGPSGLFPTDEPETLGLAEFLISHRDIALVLAYGALDNVTEAPASVPEDAPSVKRVPRPGWLEPDAALLAELAKRRAKLTEHGHEQEGEDDGSFTTWAYEHRGLIAIAVRPWDIPLDAELESSAEEAEVGAESQAQEAADEEADEPPEPGDDARRLVWCEANGETDRFRAWTPFEHPELGPVEVGGWMPYARIEPPADVAREIAAGELEFLVSLGEALPRLELVEAEAKELGAGLVEVTAVLENASFLPLRSASARRTRTVRPARVRLVLADGATRVAGPAEELVGELAGTGGRRELRWLVAGERLSSVGILVDSDHAGRIERTVEVER